MSKKGRFVCLHGHFYQPPRENPWIEDVEVQESAAPYHDWNERITHECYAANATSRILNDEGFIRRIVNNYSRISFNFGPTLLSWMDNHAPHLVDAFIEADEESREMFSGHGSAIAQVHSHIIMPLANRRDKRTQILWGISDFSSRFGREPEGMWLAETAVDLETLDIMSEMGLSFVILAPRQARRVRDLSAEKWREVDENSLNTRSPYLCKLPSGGSMAVFFYNGSIAQELAFGDLLKDGKGFAERLCKGFDSDVSKAQLVNVATDGETYGHHHRFGDMALAYALNHIEENNLAEITVYGEFLEKYPPAAEVELYENSSWSCAHGVERWRSDCGCHVGGGPDWNQNWRAPLRKAMDRLRDLLGEVFEKESREILKKPWEARDQYEPVTRDRSKTEEFLEKYAVSGLEKNERVKAMKLLEMQRHGLLMYASCGWFFDDISGLEATQVMRCACRAIQLAREISGDSPEEEYLKILEEAHSNISELGTGSEIYLKMVKPLEADLLKIGACHSLESLFDDARNSYDEYHCFVIETNSVQRVESGKLTLCSGKAAVYSKVTLEEQDQYFCALNLGDQNVLAGVSLLHGSPDSDPFSSEETGQVIKAIRISFAESDVLETIKLIHGHFRDRTYDTKDLFDDGRWRVQHKLLESARSTLKSSLLPIFKEYSHTLKAARKGRSSLPKVLKAALELLLNSDLEEALTRSEVDILELSLLHDEAIRWSMSWDGENTRLWATRAANSLALDLKMAPLALKVLEKLDQFLGVADMMNLEPNLWECQNEVYRVAEQFLDEMNRKAQKGEPEAARWVEVLKTLSRRLKLTWQT